MIRQAFILQLRPGAAEEYRRLHQAVPPEVERDEAEAGVIRETLWLHEDLVIGYSEVADHEVWDRARRSSAAQAWAHTLAPFLLMDEDGIVVSTVLEEVYHRGPMETG